MSTLFNLERTKGQLLRVFQRGLTQSAPYWHFGYPRLTAAVPELRAGLWYIVACENVGKSQFLVNVGYNVLQHNEDSVWLDLSLDDGIDQRIGYLMARTGAMPISLVHRAAMATDAEKAHRKEAFSRFLKEYGPRYHLMGVNGEDPGEVSVRFTAETVGQLIDAARAQLGPEPKLFVTVDGFHDMGLAARSQDENDRQRQKSQLLKAAATRSDALIMLTAHARKDSRRRGMSPDCVKGDDTILYDAMVLTHLFSDLNLNRDNAQIYWVNEDDPGSDRCPVHELDILKNKGGAWKGVLFYQHLPSRCWDHEADEDDQDNYRQMIFTKG